MTNRIREAMGYLRVESCAVRIHAETRTRNLVGSAGIASTPDKSKQQIAMAIQDRHRGALVRLRSNAFPS